MVNYESAGLDLIFSALADPTRRAMLERLARGPSTVGELGRPFDISKPAVTKHVKVLERAGLLRRTREGRIHRCAATPGPMEQAGGWIEGYRKFWEASFERLARYLEEPTEKGAGEPAPREPENHGDDA